MSCLSTTFNMCATQGDTFSKPFAFSTWNAVSEQFEPTDLTDVTAAFMLSNNRDGNAEFVYSGSPQITFPDASSGELQLTISPAETAEWVSTLGRLTQPASTNYQYQLRFTWPDGKVETVLMGTFTVLLAVGL